MLFTAYATGAENAHTGVVLVHDWFGISPFYTEAAERLAERGYRVLAVDLYGGRSATTHEQAGKLLRQPTSQASVPRYSSIPVRSTLSLNRYSMPAAHTIL